MGAGGIAKSLSNLLFHLEKYSDDYDVDLFLLRKDGMYLKDVPEYVNVIEAKKTLKLFGSSQKDTKKFGKVAYLRRFFVACWTKAFTNYLPLKIGAKQNRLKQEYDVAISFAHTQGPRDMASGSVEFVLDGVKAKKKFCVMHGDVVIEHLLSKSNVKKFAKFDKFFAVSKSCAEQVVSVCDKLKHNADFLYNTQRNDIIKSRALEEEIVFDKSKINLIMVSRLENQKAHLRFLPIVKKIHDEGYKFNLHIIGDGILRPNIEEYIKANDMKEYVLLYGQKQNPFPYIKAADLFVLVSYYEAAPMVYNEAQLLGVPVFTSRIISADEMIGDKGFVCDNDETSIYNGLKNVLDNKKLIKEKAAALNGYEYDNDAIVKKLLSLID